MKFKRIEIQGFKSFADKMVVSFESGVTGIVGPNGCGKSNVADAIRWVMGEQSAKTLRGSSMQDVIFNGTEKRPAQSFSEVSLVFDNTEKIFPLDFDEVVITRKLYRSGESEYLINREPCRLKDILEIFRDSGAGRDGYSVVGQGKIDELLSAKPEERRGVFEEAAGIAKFKNRKMEAERKLERTRDNLSRRGDILFELEKQLGPLKNQAEIAKKYLELKEQLKNLEINIYLYQYDNANSLKAEIGSRLQGIEEDLKDKQIMFDKAVKEFDDALLNMKNMDESIEKLRDELLLLTVGLEKNAGEVRVLEARKESVSNSILKAEQKLKELDEDSNNYDSKRESLIDKKNFRTTIVEELREKLDKVQTQYLEVVEKITESEESAESLGNETVSALGELSSVRESLSSLKTESQTLGNRLDEIAQRKKEIEQKLIFNKAELQETNEQLLKINNTLERKKLESDKLSSYNNDLVSQIGTLSRQIESQNAIFHQLISRNKLLKEMQENNEGFSVPVQRLLNDAKRDSILSSHIRGVIANMISVDKKFSVAIETALGASVNNIVTGKAKDAEFLIEYLKQNRYGRATFLPIETVRGRTVGQDQIMASKHPKSLGFANELVSYSPELSEIISMLLAGTIVTNTMQDALEISRYSNFATKIVTLDGDMVMPSGSMTGGSRKTEVGNLISRESEINNNNKEIEEKEKLLKSLTAQKEKTLNEQTETLDNLSSVSALIHTLEVQKVQQTDRASKVSMLVNEYVNELTSISEESETKLFRQKELQIKISKLEKQSEDIENKKESVTKAKKDVSGEFEKLKAQRESLLEEIGDMKVKIAEYETEISALSNELENLESAAKNSVYQIRETSVEKQQLLTELAEIEKQISKALQESAQSANQKKLQEVRDKLSKLDDYKSDLQSKLQQADVKKMQLSAEIQRISEKKTKEEMNLQKIDMDTESMQEKIWEEYELTYSGCEPYRLESFDVKDGLTESAKLKKQINALGPVNVNAIEDVKAVAERYDDLSSQNEDLQKAENDLVKIISELVSQMEDKFKEQFEKINNNFKQVFKELFGGGRAELVLQDQNNVLETGIDIKAEPPGKKLQSISLLSGGERAMTAIAILFAILKLRPMPFCVLDEIEAALDDANAERFARYLQRFAKSTQFIVITHRKPTMELADCLYGVTMEEKGVSKMVSVKLQEAVKHVQTA